MRGDRKSVNVVLDGQPLEKPTFMGTLHFQSSGHGGVFSFEYDKGWLGNKSAFNLDPEINHGKGLSYSGGANFGIFLDSSPDRWGRMLMERREVEAARREGRRVRPLSEWDFLLGVNDQTRIGALRFVDPDTGEYFSSGENAIPYTSLHEIQEAAKHSEDRDNKDTSWVSLLVVPGSSLGGARPKANYREHDGSFWIAKFPSREDRYDVAGFEKLLSVLASRCKIDVPESRLITLGDSGHRTLCIKRFDRDDQGNRLFYSSAMTRAQRKDGEDGSYLDIAQALLDNGAANQVDLQLEQLWRRMVFNLLTGNTDDHLRNHGFMATSTGLVLSPAFDMNPSTARQAHAITFDGRTSMPELMAVMEIAPLLRIARHSAIQIINEMATHIHSWGVVGRDLDIRQHDLDLMEPAFHALDQVTSVIDDSSSNKRRYIR